MGKFLPPSPCKKTQKKGEGEEKKEEGGRKKEKRGGEEGERKERRREKGRFLRLESRRIIFQNHFLESIPPHHASRRLLHPRRSTQCLVPRSQRQLSGRAESAA